MMETHTTVPLLLNIKFSFYIIDKINYFSDLKKYKKCFFN